MMNEEIGALIPAYNEAGLIGDVIRRTAAHVPLANILVIDDGSTDGTVEEAEETGVEVQRNPMNMGKGATLLRGFDIMSLRPDIEAVITLDADGQHSPEEIPSFISAYRGESADIVIGSRMHDISDMPWLRKLTNKATSAIISLRAGAGIEDSQSGYRLIRLDALEGIELVTRNFDLESEILIKAARKGAVITSVPIKTIYGEERSKIDPIADTWRFLKLVFRSFLW